MVWEGNGSDDLRLKEVIYSTTGWETPPPFHAVISCIFRMRRKLYGKISSWKILFHRLHGQQGEKGSLSLNAWVMQSKEFFLNQTSDVESNAIIGTYPKISEDQKDLLRLKEIIYVFLWNFITYPHQSSLNILIKCYFLPDKIERLGTAGKAFFVACSGKQRFCLFLG